MRILRSLFFLGVLAIVLLSTVYLLVREYALYEGVRQFRASMLELDRARASALFQEECLDRTAGGVDGVATEYHIRFTSDRQYVLEGYCVEFGFDPLSIADGELAPFISKLPGQSGILFGDEPSYVELAAFEPQLQYVESLTGWDLDLLRRSRAIGVEASRIKEFSGTLPSYSVGPVTSCAGFGYRCCNRDTQVGTGEELATGSDCDGGCFASCTDIPSVVAVTPSPYFDPGTRDIRIQPGNYVDFAYVVQPGTNALSQVEIEYGDGDSEVMAEETGVFSHAYGCELESCRYTATIVAVDADGNRSSVSVINRLDVLVGAP